jgi:hypothetical protein
MLACTQRVAAASAPSAASATEELERAQRIATESVGTHLARLWGVDTHAVE